MTDVKSRHYLTGNPDNVIPLVPVPKTNVEFMEFVFGSETRIWSTNFCPSPTNAASRHWNGRFSTLPEIKAKDESQSNTYFCTATFFESETENWRRRTEYFKAMHVVVIDDVGTKGQPLKSVVEKSSPTYVIETSEGNYQVGYVLSEPCMDIHTATYLANCMNGEIGDPSAKGANRVVRLPYGVNTKTDPVWKCKIQDFTGNRYSVEEISAAFGVDFNDAPKTGTARGNEEMTEGDFYGPVSIDEVETALKFIEPWKLEYNEGNVKEGRPAFIKVLQAIHSEHPNDTGRILAIKWASGELHDVENDRYERDEVHKRWNGFNELGNVHGRVSFGTIKMAAMANGWLPPGRDPDNWITGVLNKGKDGKIRPTMSNCIVCIQSLPIILTFDEFTQRDYIDGEPVGDDHITKVRVLIENTFGAAFGKDMTVDAMTAVAKLNAYDALKDYANALPHHDGADYIDEMCLLMGIEHPMECTFIKRQLIGGIARALSPGVKDDTAVVLLGPQGGGKSQFIEALAPVAEWFDETISGKLSNKDELAKMLGKWQIELAELASLNKSNGETSKQFMSTKVDRFRSPYGRKTQDFPRRCSVWGSTNESRHLSDETGNRRFWPVNCPTPMAAVRWLKDGNRDKVWAQALALYNAGEKWWLSKTEEDEQKEIAERHRKKSVAEQYLTNWWEDATYCFQKDILVDDCEKDTDGLYRRHFVQLGDVLRELREVMSRAPSPQQTTDALRAIGFVAHPIPTGEGKASTYQYKKGAERFIAPRGFASPPLDCALKPLSNAERARRIFREVGREI